MVITTAITAALSLNLGASGWDRLAWLAFDGRRIIILERADNLRG